MRCAGCSTTLPAGAAFCPRCGSPAPDPTAPRPVNPLDVVGPIVGIPMEGPRTLSRSFVPGAADDAPPPVRLASTEWTYPMQVTAAAWLVASAVVGVISAFQAEDSVRLAVYPSDAVRRLQMTDADALGYTRMVFNALLIYAFALALAKLLVAFRAFRTPSRWSFYAILGITAIDSLLAAVSLVSLVGDVVGGRPAADDLVMLVMRLAAAVLCGWMVVALRRFGRPWALELKPTTSA